MGWAASHRFVIDDADLDSAADIAMMTQLLQLRPGVHQRTRVFVPAALQAQFEANPRTREAHSPRRSDRSADQLRAAGQLRAHASVLRFIESGKNSGARLLCGGERVTISEFGRALMWRRRYSATAATTWKSCVRRSSGR